MDSEKQSFLVQAEDGRKFKMVIRGDLAKIPVEKIRRYLKSYGVPDGQTLMSGSLVLTDDMIGEDFGLRAEGVLHLVSAPPPVSSSVNNRPLSSTPSQSQSGRQPSYEVDHEGRRRQQQGGYREEGSRQPMRQAPSLPMDASPSSQLNPPQFRTSMQEARMAHRANAASTPPPTTPNGPSSWMLSRQPTYPAEPSSTPPRGHFSDPLAGMGHSESRFHHQPQTQAQQQQLRAASGVHQLEKDQLESENAQLRREIDALRLELDAAKISSKNAHPVESLLENAKRNLLELGKDIGMHLVLDQQLSCAIGNDEKHTLLLSFDAPTERLYVFSSLLSSIPSDPHIRMRLYEALLDGAFLGRDMAGGGCGLSLQSGIVMMSTSIQLRHCGPHALKDVVPVFIESLMRWRAVVEQICAGL